MRRQRGLSMVELMIALALGLLATLLASSLLINANAGYVAQTEAAAVEDAGRFAIEAIERAARQAGYVNWEHADANVGGAAGDRLDPAAPAAIGGLDARSLVRAGYALNGAQNNAVNGSDVLALRFAGSGRAPDGDGSMINCAGFSVSEQNDGWSIFYVARNSAGQAELRCKYRSNNDWGADAVVGGVDSFQVLYGIDTDMPPDGLANRYVSASDINALDAAITPTGASDAARARDLRRKTHWKRVASIKVALVLHSANRSQKASGPLVIKLFGDAYAGQAARDSGTVLDEQQMGPALRQRERRLFATTILLRNAQL